MVREVKTCSRCKKAIAWLDEQWHEGKIYCARCTTRLLEDQQNLRDWNSGKGK